jgi:phage shock protein PspC (stress-responsive transcriptional regulator)
MLSIGDFMIIEVVKRKLVRSNDGMFLGVLSGLARTLGLDPLVLRLLWLISVLFFGTGILIYFFMAVLMPIDGKIEEFERPKVLGVCTKVGAQYGHEVALVRMVFTAGFFLSFGLVLVVYLGLWLFLPDGVQRAYYRY